LRVIGKLIADVSTSNRRKSKPTSDLAVITKIMLSYTFTVSTYNCLLCLLVGKSDLVKPELAAAEIKLTAILPAILKPLVGLPDVSLRKSVLKDIQQLLSNK
jgi:hypothetical protein